MSTTRVPPIPITTRPSSAASGYAQGEHPSPVASKPAPPPAPPAPNPATTPHAATTQQPLNVMADVSAAHAAILADVENLNTDSKNAIRKLLTDSEKTIGVAIPALKALFGIK